MAKSNKSARTITANAKSGYKTVCQRIRGIRIDKGYTQTEFSVILKTTRENINAIERGNHAPSIAMMRTLKKRFKVSYDYLIDGKKD